MYIKDVFHYTKGVIMNNNGTYKVGIYLRLSREDEKDGQSESIENQIKFLKSIVNKMGWILFDVYIDDGYTGTNFNRPAFQRMIADVEKKNVNLITLCLYYRFRYC